MSLYLSKAILPKFIKKILNILAYRGYSANLDFFSTDRKIARRLTKIFIKGAISNNGIHNNLTVYIVIKVINPYEPKKILFDTDKDLSFDERRNLLVSDITHKEKGEFAYCWEVPIEIKSPTLYIRVDVWSPRKLYKKSNFFYYPFLLDTSGWKGFIEIINEKTDNKKMTTIFISYTWINEAHKKWVVSLSDLLIKNGFDVIVDRDLLPGQEITKFMEQGIKNADIILLICSDVFTQKANSRKGGTGYETIIGTKKYYYSEDKERFIPIVRDNKLPPHEKLPEFLGTTLYVDMDTDKWNGEPFQKLLQALNRFK